MAPTVAGLCENTPSAKYENKQAHSALFQVLETNFPVWCALPGYSECINNWWPACYQNCSQMFPVFPK